MAYIVTGNRCKTCGWSVVTAECGDAMGVGKWGEWDWWVYCSNKGCSNHEGEGLFQDMPQWIDEDSDGTIADAFSHTNRENMRLAQKVSTQRVEMKRLQAIETRLAKYECPYPLHADSPGQFCKWCQNLRIRAV